MNPDPLTLLDQTATAVEAYTGTLRHRNKTRNLASPRTRGLTASLQQHLTLLKGKYTCSF